MELKLVKSGDFLGTKCDFYLDEDSNNIYMTRRQIGEALEYADGDSGIRTIHDRNRKRLDKFSTSLKMRQVEGSRMVARDVVVYTERGIYDIARFSRKPMADKFYDWVYEQITMMRRYGAAIPNVELALEEIFIGLDESVQVTIVENYKEKLMEANLALEKAKPKIEKWEAFMDAKGNLTISDFAKSLGVKGLGRNNMFKLLRDKRVLMSGNNKNLPYQRYMEQDYFEVIATERNGKKVNVTLLTSKGSDWLFNKLKEWEVYSVI